MASLAHTPQSISGGGRSRDDLLAAIEPVVTEGHVSAAEALATLRAEKAGKRFHSELIDEVEQRIELAVKNTARTAAHSMQKSCQNRKAWLARKTGSKSSQSS